ncbi:MAG: cell division protein FtsZ, partial [Clostridia bacterium]|nr:cell division protein FtsZ [Clostridia bacterium]
IAREMNILTVGVVTKPFSFEGKRRMMQAEEGIAEFSQYVDSLVVIPNERLKLVSDTRITLFNAFSEADDVLRRGVQSISELINVTGFINLDFADVTSVMAHSGLAHMGIGSATGKDKAEAAAKMAISSPLMETSIHGATGVIISISASADVGLEDVDLASTMIANECNPDANVIWGVAFDPELEDEMRITIIATGFTKESNAKAAAKAAAAVKVETKEEDEKEEPAEEVKEAEAPVEEAAPAAEEPAPKKPTDDLDDILGSIFGI